MESNHNELPGTVTNTRSPICGFVQPKKSIKLLDREIEEHTVICDFYDDGEAVSIFLDQRLRGGVNLKADRFKVKNDHCSETQRDFSGLSLDFDDECKVEGKSSAFSQTDETPLSPITYNYKPNYYFAATQIGDHNRQQTSHVSVKPAFICT